MISTILIIVFVSLIFIGVIDVKFSNLFMTWINRLQDKIFGKFDDFEGLDYGCDKDHEEFKVSGSIIPINGYITWYADPHNLSKTISMSNVVLSVNQAFALIQPHMGKVRFKQVLNKSEAQIVIGFYNNGNPGLPHNFKDTTLAYAFLANNTNAKNIIGDMFFNEKFSWGINHGGGNISFRKVFLHEVLHSLGMFHQTHTRTGILYPTYTANNSISITQDTINGLKHLYSKYDGPVVRPPVPNNPDPVNPKDDCPDCPEISENLIKELEAELNNAIGLVNGVSSRIENIRKHINKK